MKKETGFSLVELMVAMVVGVALISLVVPGLQSIMSSNRASAGVNGLVASFKYARSMAVSENRNVRVCSSNVAKTACVVGGDQAWEDGWLVEDDDTDETLSVGDGLAGTLTTIDSEGVGEIIFTPDGRMTNPPDDNDLVITLEWEGCAGNEGRVLTVQSFGRIGATRAGC